jgi:hypothetical protein
MSNEWYNLNAVRGYPFDERATLASDNGEQIPHDVLVDCSVRFPNTLGQLAFVSALRASDAGTSLVLSCGSNIDTGGLSLIGSVVIAGRPAPGQPYRLRALQPGCDGWVVFGASVADYQGRFTVPRQSALLPRTARAYTPLPIPWVSRELDEIKLVDTVRLLAGNDLEIVNGTHEADGVTHPAVYFRLAGSDLQQTLRRYVGLCGGRPESQTCEGASIEALNDVTPHNGNIQIDFEGISAQPLAFGLLLNTAVSLPGLCAKTTVVEQPVNLCDSELAFSEISDFPPDEEVQESENNSEPTLDSETSEIIDAPFPLCLRFYSDLSLTPNTLQAHRGTWARNVSVPTTFPCSANGIAQNLWRSAAVAATATGPGPYGSVFPNAIMLHNDPAYLPGLNLRMQTAIQFPAIPDDPPDGGVMAGFLLDYRQTGESETGVFIGLRNYGQIYVARLRDGYIVPTGVRGTPPIPPGAWASLSVWAAPNTRSPSVADVRIVVQVANSPVWQQPAVFSTFAELSGDVFAGLNGLMANLAGFGFGYYQIDNVP